MTEPLEERAESPMLRNIRRLAQEIENSKPFVFCAPDEEQRLSEALERHQMLGMVKLVASPFCKPGEVYVAATPKTQGFGLGPVAGEWT